MRRKRLLQKLWFSFVLLLTMQAGLAQDKQVSGTVTDDKGSPLAGASVTAKGSKSGVTTDNTGKFSLQVPATAN
ncbi:MAG TPA: carboxypeptidase regulatory-like domain-containing protein, partial [Chitinophagaceae bacterium]|nr:carboxypeptidase regulatory-like domain-containing protein [Chitinophagaceae bacterium]